MTDIAFVWGVSARYGWGLRGQAYMLNWDGKALTALPDLAGELSPEDERARLLSWRISESQEFQRMVAGHQGQICELGLPVFVGLGNELQPMLSSGRMVRGVKTIACPVFENEAQVRANRELLYSYDAVIAASRWNEELLRDLGMQIDVRLCHEGVDAAIFNPGVPRRTKDGRFRVFSGGKAEWRKGQDLVIRAFKVFADAHDDAVLVAAWGSPWGTAALDFVGRWDGGAPPGASAGQSNFSAWMQLAGILDEQIELITPRANWEMAEVYGGIDAAVFPNRCEGGTNFVAMECMACGIPTLVRDQYGQRDLLEAGAHPLRGNDDNAVDAMVAWLEERYQSPKVAEGIGGYWTWRRHCDEMRGILSDV